MITWITVWVLTVQYSYFNNNNTSYQLTYATQQLCEKQISNHTKKHSSEARCDFEQVPIYTPKK